MKRLTLTILTVCLLCLFGITQSPACSPGDPSCSASVDLYNWLTSRQSTSVTQTTAIERQATQIPMLPGININPYHGAVRDDTKEFAKYPLAGVKFADSTMTIIAVLKVDKWHKFGMLNPWEVRKHILKRIRKLKKKYGTENICVIIWIREGAHHYGLNPSSAGSANPTSSTGAMGGGTLGWSMDVATQMVSVEYCIYK